MGHFYFLCVLLLHTKASTLNLLPAAEPHSTVQSFPALPDGHTSLSMCTTSQHWLGTTFNINVMDSSNSEFFPRKPKTANSVLKILECMWFKAFTEAQIVTGIIQILSPRWCQEHSRNLGRSFSVTNTKAEIYPQNYSCEKLLRLVKISIFGSF